MYIDAHNHLQDERLNPIRDEVIKTLSRAKLSGVMVVNGTRELDWVRVHDLAMRSPRVLPSYGLHPWFISERSPDWKDRLLKLLEEGPACVGEIGLDRWVKDHDIEDQVKVFREQVEIAFALKRPFTVHCLRAWGRLEQVIRDVQPRIERGFLMHSYGGPAEMVPFFIKAGAYFSLSGYFAHSRKIRQATTFAEHIPLERLLLETDAPDMLPPDNWNAHPCMDLVSGQPINHPWNIAKVYEFAAGLYKIPLETLKSRVADNFNHMFGPDVGSS